jgi:hypothetical protein
MNLPKNKPTRRVWVLTPTMGICLFGLLYLSAACQYPGGSRVDPVSVGFSWQYNYWCDLLGDRGQNGAANPAQPIALTAMLVLCGSLSVFFWQLPRLFVGRSRFADMSRWAGMLSMATLLFLGTDWHDTVINIAGGIGLLALGATLTGLWQSRQVALFALGVVCLGLMGVNSYIYYWHQYLFYLPVVQKITFVLFLSWIARINWGVYRLQ